jgi:DNA-binding MarR family transcriptional regulator
VVYVTELFDDPRITGLGLLAEAYAGIAARLSAQLAQHNVAPADFEVLIRLARSPGRSLRMTDLATQTTLTASGITRVVDRLEHGGLVKREACGTDRRGMFARLTERGLTKVREVMPDHLEVIDAWLFDPLTDAQQAQLLEALRAVRDRVRPDAVAGVPQDEPHSIRNQ